MILTPEMCTSREQPDIKTSKLPFSIFRYLQVLIELNAGSESPRGTEILVAFLRTILYCYHWYMCSISLSVYVSDTDCQYAKWSAFATEERDWLSKGSVCMGEWGYYLTTLTEWVWTRRTTIIKMHWMGAKCVEYCGVHVRGDWEIRPPTTGDRYRHTRKTRRTVDHGTERITL